MLAAKTLADPLLPTARSATGVTVVVTGGLVLFVEFGSPVGELTIAVFVIVPLAGAVTVKIKLLDWLAAKLPNDQLTTPPLVVPPPDALTKTTPAGNVSVTITPPADDGPEFVTVIV